MMLTFAEGLPEAVSKAVKTGEVYPQCQYDLVVCNGTSTNTATNNHNLVSTMSVDEDLASSSSSTSGDDDPCRGGDQTQYCIKVSLISMVLGALICVGLVVCRDYIKALLLWMENVNLWIASFIFCVLFIIVSFPMMWGYVLLNVAAGYLYGLLRATTLVSICALIGIFVAHELTRRFLSDYVMSKLVANESLRALLRVVEGNRGTKVVALARLTPIPFGLQNGLFAMSNMGVVRYLSASITGLMPTQVLNSYIGSTLRSMEEVLTDSSNTLTAYIVFSIQLFLTAALMAYVVRRAKRELNRTVEELEKRDLSKDVSPEGITVTPSEKIPVKGFYTRLDMLNENKGSER
jgi:protein maelstrom